MASDPYASGMSTDPYGSPSSNISSALTLQPSQGNTYQDSGDSGLDSNLDDYLPDWNNPQGQVTPNPDPTVTNPNTIQTVAPPDTGNLSLPSYNYGDYGTGTTAPGSTPAPAGSSASGNSSLQQLISSLTGGKGIGAALGGMAPYLADYALAGNAADKTAAANAKAVQPLYTQATTLLTAAGKELGLYESGAITPAQQIELDRNAATQKSQLASYYSQNGIQDSTMMQQGMQNIDNSTVIMKQSFVDDSLTKALSLYGEGLQPLMTAVQDTLISNTQLSQTMMQLMGTLASAWAYQTAQGGGGTPGTAGSPAKAGGVGGVASTLANKGISALENQLTGGSASALGADGTSAITDLSADTASNVAGVSGLDMGLNLGTDAAASSTSGLLPGSIAGADMADTAAYTPSAIEATSSGAAGGASSVAAGLGIGAAAFAAVYEVSRLLGAGKTMAPADYLKRANGQIATLTQQLKTTTDPTKRGLIEQSLQSAEQIKALMSLPPALLMKLGSGGGHNDQGIMPEKQL